MSDSCPKCGESTAARRSNVTEISGGPTVGLLYALFLPFFTKQFCPEHGRLERTDLPPAERRRMLIGPFLWLAAIIAIPGLSGWAVSQWLTGD